MRKLFGQPLKALTLAGILASLASFPAAAAIQGDITSVSSNEITGWAWDTGSFDTVVTVEIQICPENSSEPADTITVKAEEFDEYLSASIGDGWHSFSAKAELDALGSGNFEIRAYSVMGETRHQLGSTFLYSNGSGERIIAGPGDAMNAAHTKTNQPDQKEDSEDNLVPGEYLGLFTITGYCSCEQCSGGHNYTYSGTVPQANHTLSADLSLLPLGTKVIIDDIVYTVEDKGSEVDGKKVDIFFATHEEALAFGTQTGDVYLAVEP